MFKKFNFECFIFIFDKLYISKISIQNLAIFQFLMIQVEND